MHTILLSEHLWHQQNNHYQAYGCIERGIPLALEYGLVLRVPVERQKIYTAGCNDNLEAILTDAPGQPQQPDNTDWL